MYPATFLGEDGRKSTEDDNAASFNMNGPEDDVQFFACL